MLLLICVLIAALVVTEVAIGFWVSAQITQNEEKDDAEDC